MKIIKNEKGIALVMVLVLSVITLAIMAGLIYMVTIGTQTSGMQKRYKTALESGLGGADVTYELIGARGDPGIPGITNFSPVACLTAKLNTSTSATNWAACTDYADATSLTIDPADSDTYDMTFSLGTVPLEYDVYAKIVDTVEGNSAPDEDLKGCTGVTCGDPGIQVMSIPYLYTIEIDAQNSTNAAERAKLSILYQY